MKIFCETFALYINIDIINLTAAFCCFMLADYAVAIRRCKRASDMDTSQLSTAESDVEKVRRRKRCVKLKHQSDVDVPVKQRKVVADVPKPPISLNSLYSAGCSSLCVIVDCTN